jgi:NAD(P)-dependent dehydrogenase (short-subunit alcohol dehydrogenase family)
MNLTKENKVALITGAALGFKNGGPSIGSSIAFTFASKNYSVAVIDIQEEMGQKTADTINQKGGHAIFIKTDVSKTEDVKHAVNKIKQEYGKLHCLVNCAASYQGDLFKNVVDKPEKDWNHIINVNLNGYFRCAKYAIPSILNSGKGTIINISSAAAFKVIKNFSVYPVTKAAINALTRVLAIDFAPKIRTNAICPGFVRIANSEGDRTPEQVEEWIHSIAQKYPLKRVCSVEEIAHVCYFLASDASSYINGQCITVDGGRYILDTHEF